MLNECYIDIKSAKENIGLGIKTQCVSYTDG